MLIESGNMTKKCTCIKKMLFLKGAYVPSFAFCRQDNCEVNSIQPKEELTITLSNNEAPEFSSLGTEIGTFSTDKTDVGYFVLQQDFLYQNDNDKFTIENKNKLKIASNLFYIPGSSYKITVKYVGPKHYGQQDFFIAVSKNDSSDAEIGTDIQISSEDNSVEAVFDNITSAGKVTFNKASSQEDDVLLCYIDSEAEFEGNITISFNDERINPDNDPKIVHIRYDSETDMTYFEDVTTEVTEGRMTAVVSSLSPFAGFFEPIPPETWGGDGPSLECDNYTIGITPPSPCPGNQTRGNWAITDQGVGLPRLLGGACGCWVPSFFTVDMIITAATSIGALKAGICGLARSIASYRNSIKLLASSISSLRSQIGNLGGLIGTARARIATMELAKDGLIAVIGNLEDKVKLAVDAFDEVKFQTEEAYKILKNLGWDGDFAPDDLNIRNALNNWTYFADKKRAAEQTLETVQQTLQIQKEAFVAKQIEISMEKIKIIQYENDIRPLSQQLIEEEAGLAVQEAAKKTAEDSLLEQTKDLGGSALALYSFLNEISVQKACESGQTLNPLTCECCPNCTDGKVFPDPMNGCDCECPPGTEPCLKVGDNGCYTPCPEGQTRQLSDCQCPEPTPTPTPGLCKGQGSVYTVEQQTWCDCINLGLTPGGTNEQENPCDDLTLRSCGQVYNSCTDINDINGVAVNITRNPDVDANDAETCALNNGIWCG
jgi:hypothetical protein